jgi:hypothetical protein
LELFILIVVRGVEVGRGVAIRRVRRIWHAG